MGIDFGERRIGLALSDPTGTLASPLEVVKRRAGKRPPLGALEAVARDHDVKMLVMGLPLSPSGEDTEWTREVRWVGEALAARLSIPVDFIDERFTSARAERAIRGLGLKKSRREDKSLVDAQAAVYILQAWLDRKRSQSSEMEQG